MNDQSQTRQREERLDAVLAEVMKAEEKGAPLDRDEILARHADLGEELKKYFADLDQFEQLAGPLRELQGNGSPDAVEQPVDQLRGLLGDFRILREVGRGGMGVVYEAEQLSLKRRVALKVLPFAATLDPRHLQRFKNEALAAASLDHPHIVKVHAVGQERGVHYFAMQFIDGQTMAEFIRQQTTTGGREYFENIARLGIEAAEALEHAHQMGIVHRDIKPANLMLDAERKLWITDFGLARNATGCNLTTTGDLLGTLRYMSPEQALSKRGVVDHRTDIYSLGVTLYELLTLKPAFAGHDPQEVLQQFAFEEPTAPRQLNREIPADLETIVLKAMAKDAANRYATAAEMATDLRCFLQHEPIHARRPWFLRRAKKWLGKHLIAIWTVVLGLLTIALFFGGWKQLEHRSNHPAQATGHNPRADGLRARAGGNVHPPQTSPFKERNDMLLSKLFPREKTQPRRKQLSKKQKNFRPKIEPLEDRTVPASVFWDGGAGTFNWNDAANWSGDVLPGAGDDVTINVAGDVTIIHASGNTAIKSLTSHESIDLTGGSLTLLASSTVNGALNNAGTVDVQAGTLSLHGGGASEGSFTVAAGANLVFSGTHDLSNTSSITGPGQVVFSGGNSTVGGNYDVTGETLIIGNAPVTFTGTAAASFGTLRLVLSSNAAVPITTSRELAINNQFEWGSGTIAGSGAVTIAAGAELLLSQGVLSGANRWHLDGVTLNNHGTAKTTITAPKSLGEFFMKNGAEINNFGTFLAQSEVEVIFTHASGDTSAVAFNNLGTFVKATNPRVWFGVNFNNSGTVEVQAGRMQLSRDSASSGSFTVAADAELRILSGTHMLSNTSSISGAGQVVFAGGNSTVGGNYDVTGETLIIGNAPVTFTGTAAASFGTLRLVLSSNAAVPITTSKELAINNQFEWGSGTIAGSGAVTIAAGAELLLSQGVLSGANRWHLDGVTLNNHGTAKTTITAPKSLGEFFMKNGAEINNFGTFLAQSEVEVIFTHASGDTSAVAFNNLGTFVKATNPRVWFGVNFNNSGTVEVQAGRMQLSRDSASSGSFTVAADAELRILSGTHMLSNTSSISGAGQVVFAGGNSTVGGNYDVTGETLIIGNAPVTFTGTAAASFGTLRLVLSSNAAVPITTSRELAINNQFEWGSGTIAGSGAVTIAAGAELLLSQGVIGGANRWHLDGVTLNNHGTAKTTITAPKSLGEFFMKNGAEINNFGTFLAQSEVEVRFTRASGDTSAVAFNNLGTFVKATNPRVWFGVNFNNSGTVEVQAGQMQLSGDSASSGSFTVAADAELRILSGTHMLSNTSSISGAGQVVFFADSGNSIASTVGGTYDVTGGTFIGGNFANRANVDFTGTVVNVGSSLTVSGIADFHATPITVDHLTMTKGTLTSGALTVNEQFDWSSGTIAGTGDITVPAGATLDMSWTAPGTIGSELQGRRLNNHGTAQVMAPANTSLRIFRLSDGAEVNNWGSFLMNTKDSGGANPDLQFVRTDTSQVAFNNHGTLEIQARSNGVQIGVDFHNAGTVDVQAGWLRVYAGFFQPVSFVQTAGTTRLSGGDIVTTSSPGFDIQGGSLTGSGNIFGSVSNGGDLSPGSSPGSVAISQNYTQTADGVFNVELGGLTAGTQHDQLDVSQTVTLAGSLEVSLINGFSPQFQDTFTIINNAGTDAVVGTFNGLAEGAIVNAGAAQFAISYVGGDGNDVVLTASNRPPMANAGGPYSIAEGDSLTLDASGSTDADGDTLTYSWDINGDGIFGDASGSNPTLTWADLQALGINDDGSFTATVRVNDGQATDESSAPLTVVNVAPTAAISGPAQALAGDTLAFTLSATDPSPADETAGFTFNIDWNGDGVIDQTVNPGDSLTVEHTFNQAGAFTIHVTATDKDGGVSDAATHDVLIIQPVEIDVRDTVNLNNEGVIMVTIFSTSDFDASLVDVGTVVFAGASAVQHAYEDVNGDGILDLVLHFHTQDTNLREVYEQLLADDINADGELDSNNQEAEVTLTAQTVDEVFIEGNDELNLFLSGKSLRELLDDMAARGVI